MAGRKLPAMIFTSVDLPRRCRPSGRPPRREDLHVDVVQRADRAELLADPAQFRTGARLQLRFPSRPHSDVTVTRDSRNSCRPERGCGSKRAQRAIGEIGERAPGRQGWRGPRSPPIRHSARQAARQRAGVEHVGRGRKARAQASIEPTWAWIRSSGSIECRLILASKLRPAGREAAGFRSRGTPAPAPARSSRTGRCPSRADRRRG
jgi:hypothetical protein